MDSASWSQHKERRSSSKTKVTTNASVRQLEDYSWRDPIHTSHGAVLLVSNHRGGQRNREEESHPQAAAGSCIKRKSKSVTVILAPRREHVISGI